MKRTSYNTKQSRAILDYIISQKESHVTAAQIVRHFDGNNEEHIGRTTVYRRLDKLAEENILRKCVVDGRGACYEYIGNDKGCGLFHMKCEGCGELIHLHCGAMDNIKEHIADKHRFNIDMMKSIFYGTCDNCSNSAGTEGL